MTRRTLELMHAKRLVRIAFGVVVCASAAVAGEPDRPAVGGPVGPYSLASVTFEYVEVEGPLAGRSPLSGATGRGRASATLASTAWNPMSSPSSQRRCLSS